MVASNRQNDDGRRQQPLVLILLQMMAAKEGTNWVLRCGPCGVEGVPLMREEFMHLIGDAYEAGWRVLPCDTTSGRMMVPCCPKHAGPLMAKYRTQAGLLEAGQVSYALEITGDEI